MHLDALKKVEDEKAAVALIIKFNRKNLMRSRVMLLIQSRKLLREQKAAAAHLLARCIAATAAATYKTALKEAKKKEEEERDSIETIRKYEEEKQK